MKENPKIENAKSLNQQFNKDMTIIFYFGIDGYGYASYGKNKAYCQTAKEIADILFKILQEKEY